MEGRFLRAGDTAGLRAEATRAGAEGAAAVFLSEGALAPQFLPMRYLPLLFALALPVIPAAAQDTANTRPHWQKRLVADYDEGSKFNAAPYTYAAEQIPYDKLTDIIHAGIGFDAEADLGAGDHQRGVKQRGKPVKPVDRRAPRKSVVTWRA